MLEIRAIIIAIATRATTFFFHHIRLWHTADWFALMTACVRVLSGYVRIEGVTVEVFLQFQI